VNVLEILRNGRERIARGWCMWARGNDASGHYVNGWNSRAVAWCALGALDGAIGHFCDETAAEKALAEALPPEWNPTANTGARIVTFNNSHTQADVLAVFDKAIAKLAPHRRSDAELVADLMTRVMGAPIPEDAAA
jgi:hypothetical protein